MASEPIRASVPGEWPNAEPESVRATEAAEFLAERRAELEKLDQWTRGRVEKLAEVLNAVDSDQDHTTAWQLGYLTAAAEAVLYAFGIDQ